MQDSLTSQSSKPSFPKHAIELMIVGALLLLHFSLSFTASQRKSPVFDESVHIAGGYSYWLENDYRINPENGNFPQRWAAIPLMFQNLNFPNLRQIPLHQTDEWTIAGNFIYKSGNNPETILKCSRAMIIILSMITGLAVYYYSRKAFGTGGGMISLVLYVLCPEILAHAGFATSDMAATMAFTLALICIWNVINRITVGNIIISSLALSLLFVSKFSAFIIIPAYLILILVRLRSGKQVDCALFSHRIIIDTQMKQFLAYSALLLLNLIIVSLFIWMSYGFRFSMLKDSAATDRVTLDRAFAKTCKPCGVAGKILLIAKERKLLPEAYLFGFAFVLNNSKERNSFLNGELSNRGWWYFFIYSFMMKTPLPLLLLLALSLSAILRPRTPAYEKLQILTPFLVFILIYFLFAMSSRMNIGNRHLLPVYPGIFIICGYAYSLLRSKNLPITILTAFLISWFVLESYKIRPHYLSYFNQLAGGPANGYKHLSDSSLDWGQDLKELRKWLYANNQKKENVYLSYFGTADISYYMHDYRQLPCYFEQGRRGANDFFELKGGIYCISATMFQLTYFDTALQIQTGLNPAKINEAMYSGISSEMKKYLECKTGTPLNEADLTGLKRRYDIYDYMRFAKLCLYLRLQHKEPDAFAGYSILIFRLTEKEIEDALSR